MHIRTLFLLLSFLSWHQLSSQTESYSTSELYETLKLKDSLVFNVAYDKCDTSLLRTILSDDLEFYHDKDGLLQSKEMLIQGFPNLCKMNYKPIRRLTEGSLEVFPLYQRGQLYGAIQTGRHKFYGKEEGKPEYLTSSAQFTHVWILEGGDWKLKRILSYDHIAPE